MNKQIIILLITCLITSACLGQNTGDSLIQVRKLPVKEGFIKVYKEMGAGIEDPSSYVNIISADHHAYNIEKGKVINVKEEDSAFTVLVKSGDKWLLYANLSSVSVKKDQVVSAGELIGDIKRDSQSAFSLKVMIGIGEKIIDRFELEDYFRKKYLETKDKN